MTKLPLMSLEEAQERLLSTISPLPIEHVDIAGALGRYLAAPLIARRTQPAANISAMDGYAVASDDLTGPWRLIGESAAGRPYTANLEHGEAIRISTGALLPPNIDAVVVQEDVQVQDTKVTLTGNPPSPSSRHVRPKGMDFSNGDILLPAGTRIGASQAALAFSAGNRYLPVHRLPSVVVIDSGDELADNPDCCAPHQVPASNGIMLAAMIGNVCGIKAERLGPIGDTLDELTYAFRRASEADVIVTTGGASVGDHDLVRPALHSMGAKIDFWRVAIKPGKPILLATRPRAGRTDQLVIGLPGNPVSTYVTGILFLLPALRALLGAQACLPQSIATKLAAPLPPTGARREFLRGIWNGETVNSQALQDSSALRSLALSNVLIDRPAGSGIGQAGDIVRVFLLESFGIA